MWYLSRTPQRSDPRTQPDDSSGSDNVAFRNSIFSLSDNDLFENISIIDVPDEGGCNEDDRSRPQGTIAAWEWFAYLPSVTQFHGVAVPKDRSTMVVQVIAVLRDQILCAKVGPGGEKSSAALWCYSRVESQWREIPTMEFEGRRLFGAAGAIFGGWLYLAGGFRGNPSHAEPSNYLNSVERLNLKTWEWEAIQPMQKPRAFATGLAHKGKFYVVGGKTSKHSAEVYNPVSKTWQLLKSFVPKQAQGYAITSMYVRMLMLTWHDSLGVKLWMWNEVVNPILIGGWRLISFFPNNAVERTRFVEHGARMVRVGMEMWVLVGETDDQICHVDGPGGWPIFPAPDFRVGVEHEVVRKGDIYGFSFKVGRGIVWRQIPVYSIP